MSPNMKLNMKSNMKKAFCLALTVFVLVGCQQKKNKKQSLRQGRGLRGSTMVNNGANSASASALQCGSYNPGKAWGEITSYQGDQQFYQEVQLLTNPVLRTLPFDDQLGMVSGQSGQYTGVRFWGSVRIANGMVDPNASEIRLEIYDDRACQPKADGTIRSVVPVHIGANQPGFLGVEGYVAGQAKLTFLDNYGAIILDGQIINGYYSGTVSYTTTDTGGQARILGRFQIPAQGFFTY